MRPGDPVGRKDRPLSMALNSCPWAASDCKPNGPAEAAPGSSAFTSRSHSRYSSFGVSGRSCRGGSAVRAGAPPNDLGSGRRCRLGPRNSSAHDSRCGAARPATHFIPPRRARWSHVNTKSVNTKPVLCLSERPSPVSHRRLSAARRTAKGPRHSLSFPVASPYVLLIPCSDKDFS